LTLGEVEKIDPDAIWRLDISSDVTRSAFSHNLGQLLPSASGSFLASQSRILGLQAEAAFCFRARGRRLAE
jgi:hypothetical protein